MSGIWEEANETENPWRLQLSWGTQWTASPRPRCTHLQEQHDHSADDGHQLPYQPDFILLRHVGLLGNGVQDKKCFLMA